MTAWVVVTRVVKLVIALGLTLSFPYLLGTVLVVMIRARVLLSTLRVTIRLTGRRMVILCLWVRLSRLIMAGTTLVLSSELLILCFTVVRKANVTFLLTSSLLICLSRRLTMLSPLEIPDLLSMMRQGCLGLLSMRWKSLCLVLISRFVVVGSSWVRLAMDVRLWRMMLNLLSIQERVSVVYLFVRVVCRMGLPSALWGLNCMPLVRVTLLLLSLVMYVLSLMLSIVL